MRNNADYQFESFERYFGDIQQVKRTMNHCKICGAELIHTHNSDYKNLIVQESANCPDCGAGNSKFIHILN